MSYPDQYRSQTVQLDNSWPGLEARPNEVHVDPATLDGVASQLQGQLGGGAVSPQQLQPRVDPQICTGWFGYWETGGYMQHSLQTAGGSIAFYYERLVNEVKAAAALFRATAEDYRQLDQGVAVDLQKRAADWDALAAQADSAAPAGGLFRDSTPVPFINQYENVGEYDADWIAEEMKRIEQAQTWQHINGAGDALGSAAERLEALVDTLRGRATELDAQWSSETSAAAQKALQRIAGTARGLAEDARQTAEFAHLSADTLQRAATGFSDDRSVIERGTDVLTIGANPNLEADRRQALELLNESYRDINYTTLPAYVNAELPNLPAATDDGVRPPGESARTAGATTSGYVPPSAPVVPPPPLAPTATSAGAGATGSALMGSPAGVPGVGELAGPGSGFDGGGIPGGDPTLPGEQEWSPGGLAGAGSGIGPAAGLSPGAPTGPAGAVTPASAGGPGAPAALGPGGAGIVPGAIGSPGRGTTVGAERPGATGVAGRPGPPGGPGVGARPGAPGVMPTNGSGVGAAGPGSRPGATGGPGGRPGAAAATGASGPVGARPGTSSGPMPMGRTGRYPDRENKQHDSWLVEDDDPWRADDDVPPPVIR